MSSEEEKAKSAKESQEKTIFQRIIDKEKANYCDYYKIGINNNSDAIKNDALAQANALFKK